MSEYYIGLISGTSIDGIDAVLMDFSRQPYKPLASLLYPFDTALQQKLVRLANDEHISVAELIDTDVVLARNLAAATNKLLESTNVRPEEVQAIGSHGQTIRHLPFAAHPSTLQIGDPNTLVELTGITTIADFRRRDMAAGGQGAPLVPAFHAVCCRSSDINRVIVNIGGIANITTLPADPTATVMGFDTGPGNNLCDAWIYRQQQQRYDARGAWASQGKVQNDILDTLLADPYFSQAAPKSSGPEYFNLSWLQQHIPELDKYAAQDIQATLCELSARSICNAIMQYAGDTREIYVSGGGAHNTYMMSRIAAHAQEMELSSIVALGLDPDLVEAMAFAWLARQTLQCECGNLPSVTCARYPVILGGVYRK